MQHKQKLAAAARRELAILERSVNVVRDAAGNPTGLAESGLKLVELLATAGGSRNYIAAKLLVTQSAFKKLLGRPDSETPARLAFERGHALHEQDVANRLLAADAPAASLVFYAKSKLHWLDAPPPAQQNNIMITLPAAQSRESYFKSLGISGPIDSRSTPHDVTPKPKALGAGDKPLYEASTNHGGLKNAE